MLNLGSRWGGGKGRPSYVPTSGLLSEKGFERADQLPCSEPHRIIRRQPRLGLGLLDRAPRRGVVEVARVERDGMHGSGPREQAQPRVELGELAERRDREAPGVL